MFIIKGLGVFSSRGKIFIIEAPTVLGAQKTT